MNANKLVVACGQACGQACGAKVSSNHTLNVNNEDQKYVLLTNSCYHLDA